MSKKYYTITYSVSVEPTVTEEQISSGAYVNAEVLGNAIDGEIENISIEEEKG